VYFTFISPKFNEIDHNYSPPGPHDTDDTQTSDYNLSYRSHGTLLIAK